MKAYNFRIYPSKKQEVGLKHHLWIAKNLWNELLACSKKIYKKTGDFLSKKKLQKMAKGNGLYSQTQQNVAHKVSDAIFQVFKLKEKGAKCSFPRFKSFDRIMSLSYPQFSFNLKRELKVTQFGEISIKQHRRVEGKIKAMMLKRECSGKWFAVFCVEQKKRRLNVNNEGKVGVNLGLMKFAVLSDGEITKNPKHLKQHEDKLAFLQWKLLNKKKGSNNRRKVKRKVALLYEKVSNTRMDFLHRTSTQLANYYSFIALEKLASREMPEQNFGKSINNAGWNMANILCYKAEEAGCRVVFVDTEDTSKKYSECEATVEKELSNRTHDCHICGLSIDRNLNAARSILIRATEGHSRSNPCKR